MNNMNNMKEWNNIQKWNSIKELNNMREWNSSNNLLKNRLNQLQNKSINCRTIYTLQYSQPYVLSSEWPKDFTPKGCSFEPDLSTLNIKPSNDRNLSNEKYGKF